MELHIRDNTVINFAMAFGLIQLAVACGSGGNEAVPLGTAQSELTLDVGTKAAQSKVGAHMRPGFRHLPMGRSGHPGPGLRHSCNGVGSARGLHRLRIDEYGYITAGPWSGWGYAFIVNPNNLNDTISPSCDNSGCTPAMSAPLCAAGTLAADTTYQSVAGLGFNLNQPEFVADGGSSGPAGVIMSGKGLIVGFSNPGNTDVRVQLSDPTNTIYWCYDIAGAASPVFIPWASFNTACWDNSGTAFDVSQQVAAIQLIIPSEATTDVAFNMCLSGVGTY